MGKVRVLYNPDGSVKVIHPAPKSKFTEQECLERMTPDDAVYDDIDVSELPKTREARGAWRGVKGSGITIDKIEHDKIIATRKENAEIETEMRKMAKERLRGN